MKLLGKFPFLLAPVLLASVVFAQNRDERAAESVSASDDISAARSSYIAGASPDAKPDAKGDNTLAQVSRTRPGMRFPPQRGYSRGSYQTPWMNHGSAGHVLIGAAIGFGVGAALGAKNSAQNGTPVSGGIVIGGGLFGLIGGCVGGAIGSSYGGLHPFARRRLYRPSWSTDDDDEKSDFRAPSTRGNPEIALSARPASPIQPTGFQETTQPASVAPPHSNLDKDFGNAGTLSAATRITQ